MQTFLYSTKYISENQTSPSELTQLLFSIKFYVLDKYFCIRYARECNFMTITHGQDPKFSDLVKHA